MKLSMDKVIRGEVVRMALYLPETKTMHEFSVVAIGDSHNAIKFLATHGPVNAGREEFFWIPKSWSLVGVPRRAGLFYIPIKKAREIGVHRVLTFN